MTKGSEPMQERPSLDEYLALIEAGRESRPAEARLADEIKRLRAVIQDMAHELLQVERHCPCGARPETLRTHPHAIGCPVARGIDIWRTFAHG